MYQLGRCLLWFVGLLLLANLMACQQQKTLTYFLTHPESIQDTYNNCLSREKSANGSMKAECRAVLAAIPVFQSYFSELITQPRVYGRNIMQAEIKLVQLQKAYQQAKLNKAADQVITSLQAQIAAQCLLIKSRFALIKLLTG